MSVSFGIKRFELRYPEIFKERVAIMEAMYEEEFLSTHPAYCWNYPTAISWLDAKWQAYEKGNEADLASIFFREYMESTAIEMIVRIANRVGQASRP